MNELMREQQNRDMENFKKNNDTNNNYNFLLLLLLLMRWISSTTFFYGKALITWIKLMSYYSRAHTHTHRGAHTEASRKVEEKPKQWMIFVLIFYTHALLANVRASSKRLRIIFKHARDEKPVAQVFIISILPSACLPAEEKKFNS